MKKLLCVLLLFGCAFLVSCRKQSEPEQSTEPTTEYIINAEALLEAEEVVHHDCSVHGHVFSKATCQKAATCFYCGEQQGELAAHDWTHATCLQKATCTVCGAQSGEYASHSFTAATCAAPASCVYCGVTTGSALPHQFRAATCVSPSMCIVCMKKQGSALGHIWTGGSCTGDKVCTRCNRRLTAPGHQMTGGSCTEDAVCAVCGYTEKAKGHQFVDGVCTVCGKSTFQAQQDAARTTTASTTESESTLPAPDVPALQQYGETIRGYLQSAHDNADAAFSTPADEGRELALSATKDLRNAQAQIDEALALCKDDERLAALADALSDVNEAIRKSAEVTTFYDSSYLKDLTTIRADCTKALELLRKYGDAVEKL